MRPTTTLTAAALIRHIEALRAVHAQRDLDEASTFTRYDVRARIETYDTVLVALRADLPFVEDEAREPVIADDPFDPSLPFTRGGEAREEAA